MGAAVQPQHAKSEHEENESQDAAEYTGKGEQSNDSSDFPDDS